MKKNSKSNFTPLPDETHKGKMRSKKTKYLEDYFHYLPDELLLCIFSFLLDLKLLCQCSAVCKRFSSVISQVRTVSITLRSNEGPSIQSFDGLRPLFRDTHHVGRGDSTFQMLSCQELKLPILLKKFKNLESVCVEYTHARDTCDSSLKWKVKFRSNSVAINSLVAFLPGTVYRKSEYDPNSEQEYSLDFIDSQVKNCIFPSYGCFVKQQSLSCLLFNHHGSLRNVTITDSENQGKLVVRDEQIIGMRNDQERHQGKFPVLMKIAWVPVLDLPLSGYVMRGVCLAVVEFPTEPGAALKWKSEDDINAWEFEEEEKVFGEAVREIFTNHQNKILVVQIHV